MKESKDEAILPCYRDGYGVWHYSDDTHEKVYGLNEQMCDIGKTMSDAKLMMDDIVRRAEENIRLYNDNNKYARFVRAAYESKFGKPKEKDIMEEKKTKKMTKAEAFEYLKGKKVRTCGEPRLLEKKLMECGYRWMRGVTWENDDYEDFWAYFMGYDGLITFVDIECSDYYECHNFDEISADDILSIEIVDEKKKSENVSIELEKWIGVIRDKFCCYGWSIVISASNFALFSGDLIKEKRIKE